MANNKELKDGNGVLFTTKTTETAGVNTPHVNVDNLQSFGQKTMANSHPVVIASDQSSLPVNQAGQSTTGTITALNGTVVLPLLGATGFAIDLRGTYTATLACQVTIDGTNWVTIPILPVGSNSQVATITSTTAQGAWNGNGNGCASVRVIATAFTSGTVNVTLRAMQAAGLIYQMPSGQTTQAVSGTVTANIGTGSLAAGTNAIGDVGLQIRANATGAASKFHLVSAATTNATVVKASAGRIVSWRVSNTNAAWRYVKLHNSATTPTAGTGVVETIAVPPNSTVTGTIVQGSGFSTGIGITTVTGASDSDNTAVGANDLIIDLFFG